MTKVKAPNKTYTGTSASVDFTDGVGYTDNAWLLSWFTDHGYQVEADAPPEAQIEPTASEIPEPEASAQPEAKPAEKSKAAPSRSKPKK